MAKHPSALKAHRQSLKHQAHNRQLRSRLRTALKAVRVAIDGNDPAAARAALRQTSSLLDKMAAKRIIHRNTANRHKSRLAQRLASKPAA